MSIAKVPALLLEKFVRSVTVVNEVIVVCWDILCSFSARSFCVCPSVLYSIFTWEKAKNLNEYVSFKESFILFYRWLFSILKPNFLSNGNPKGFLSSFVVFISLCPHILNIGINSKSTLHWCMLNNHIDISAFGFTWFAWVVFAQEFFSVARSILPIITIFKQKKKKIMYKRFFSDPKTTFLCGAFFLPALYLDHLRGV